MTEKKGFDLGGYIEVKDRIARFYELYGQGRLVTGEVRLTTEPDGKPRVMVQGLAYRTPDDPLPGVGWSWLELPGTTPYTKGSEIENAETSAWGRAIGSLGILIDHSIASANEVQNKAGPDIPPTDPADETLRPLGPIERVGAIAKGTGRHSDMEWRRTPDDGYRFGFLLEVGDGKPKPQVIVEGPLAFALFVAETAPLEGIKVTVKGDLFEVHVPKRKTIYRIVATSLETDEWTLPAKVAEAETEPLGLVDDDLSDLPDGVWIANEASDAGSRR